jgi:hypothetical protein
MRSIGVPSSGCEHPLHYLKSQGEIEQMERFSYLARRLASTVVRPALYLAAGLFVLSLPLRPAGAQTYTWVGPSGGNWYLPSNWSTSGPNPYPYFPNLATQTAIAPVGSAIGISANDLVGTLQDAGTISISGGLSVRNASVGTLALYGGAFGGGAVKGIDAGQSDTFTVGSLLVPYSPTGGAGQIANLTFTCQTPVTLANVYGLQITNSVFNAPQLTLDGGSVTWLGGAWNVPSTLCLLPPSDQDYSYNSLDLYADFTVAEGQSASGSLRIESEAEGTIAFVNDGTVSLTSPSALLTSCITVPEIQNNGTLELESGAANCVTCLQGSFNNAGTVLVDAGANIALNEPGGEPTGPYTYSQSAGTFVVDGVVAGQLTPYSYPLGYSSSVLNIDGGELEGTGALYAVNCSGTIAPGHPDATGTLAIGNLTQTPSSSTNIRIGGPAPGSQYDVLALGAEMSNTVELGGALNVSFINGYVPPVGTTFNVVQYSVRGASAFSSINVSPPSVHVLYNYVSTPTGTNPEAGALQLTVVGAWQAPRRVTIVGPAQIYPGTAYQYQLAVTFADGSVWTSTFPPATLTVNGTAAPGGVVELQSMPANQWVTLKATFSTPAGQVTSTRVVQAL